MLKQQFWAEQCSWAGSTSSAVPGGSSPVAPGRGLIFSINCVETEEPEGRLIEIKKVSVVVR